MMEFPRLALPRSRFANSLYRTHRRAGLGNNAVERNIARRFIRSLKIGIGLRLLDYGAGRSPICRPGFADSGRRLTIFISTDNKATHTDVRRQVSTDGSCRASDAKVAPLNSRTPGCYYAAVRSARRADYSARCMYAGLQRMRSEFGLCNRRRASIRRATTTIRVRERSLRFVELGVDRVL